MNPPQVVLDPITAAGGQSARAFARALYDLEGHLGETWVITDGAQLFLSAKRIGGDFKLTAFPLKDLDEVSVRDDGAFAYFQIQVGTRTLNLKFSVWDRAKLDAICQCWADATHKHLRAGTRFLQADPVSTSHAPPAPLTPVVAFCAAVQAMIRADGVTDPSELFVLQTAVHEPGAIERGRIWLEEYGQAALIEHLKGLLSPEQKLCLLANVAAVGMADGLWRSKEQSWLDQLQQTLSIPDADFEPVFNVLMILNGLNVFDADTAAHAGPMAPMVIFSASLQAMASADGEFGRDEQTLLWQLVDDPEMASEGANLLQRDGVDTVMRYAAMTLNEAQKICLMANLLKVAMVDGVLRSREQALLEQFRVELGVEDAHWQGLHHALMVKNDLTVFAI